MHDIDKIINSEHINKQARKASMAIFFQKFYGDHKVITNSS